jgi:hypothetical protein
MVRTLLMSKCDAVPWTKLNAVERAPHYRFHIWTLSARPGIPWLTTGQARVGLPTRTVFRRSHLASHLAVKFRIVTGAHPVAELVRDPLRNCVDVVIR